jgi:hypothetical protein
MRINPVRRAFPMSKARPTPSILAATAHLKSGIETFAGKSYTQQYAVNYSLPE